MEVIRYRLGPGDTWKIMTGFIGPKGDKGDQGIQGIQGIQGDKGDKGDKGDPGMTEEEIKTFVRAELGVIEYGSY